MRDIEHKHKIVEMERWIADYIYPFGNEKLKIEGYGTIKRVALTFIAIFWWLLIRCRLFLIT